MILLFYKGTARDGSGGWYLDKLRQYLVNEEIKSVDIDKEIDWDNTHRYLEEAAAIVLVCNVVLNSIPSQVLSFLEDIEQAVRNGESIPGRFYSLLYTDLYEGEQTVVAMGMLKNFCIHANISWGRGLGIGGNRILRAQKPLIFRRNRANLNMEYFDISIREQAVHIREHMYGVEDYICPIGVTRIGYMRQINHEIRKKHRVNIVEN